MKKNLFISKKAHIAREAKALVVTIENNVNKIPLGIIENLFIIGGAINLTAGARNMLLEHNKSIFYYSSSYNMQGVLSNTKLQSNYRNRLLQYEAYNKDSFEVAKYIVSSKIDSIKDIFDIKTKYIKYFGYIPKIDNKSLGAKLDQLKIKAHKSKKINELLGVEGNASSYMFSIFKKALQDIGIDDFKKREYRPTKDKVNGLLSFTYTLYSNLLYGLVLGEGYDPYIGFLHKKRGTHYAFVSDLIETDRAKLTIFVLNLFKDQILSDDDFDGIYLNYEGRKKFLQSFNNFVYEYFDESRNNLFLIAEAITGETI